MVDALDKMRQGTLSRAPLAVIAVCVMLHRCD